jgi:hypothetical protein
MPSLELWDAAGPGVGSAGGAGNPAEWAINLGWRTVWVVGILVYGLGCGTLVHPGANRLPE